MCLHTECLTVLNMMIPEKNGKISGILWLTDSVLGIVSKVKLPHIIFIRLTLNAILQSITIKFVLIVTV